MQELEFIPDFQWPDSSTLDHNYLQFVADKALSDPTVPFQEWHDLFAAR